MKFTTSKKIIVLVLFVLIGVIGYQYSLIIDADVDLSYKNIRIRQLEISVEKLKKDANILESSLAGCEINLNQCKKNLQINMNNNSILQQEKQSLETKRFFGW